MPLKVVIAVGGTLGHLGPAMDLAEMLSNDATLLFLGHGLAKNPFFDPAKPFADIVSASSKKGFFSLLKGVGQAVWQLFRFRPHVVVGFGSYHVFPVLFAALLLRCKIVLFEPNCSLGKVNRFFLPFAKKIAFQFPVAHRKAAYVPLLPWIAKKRVSSSLYWKKDPRILTILVFGGSQGALFINEVFQKASSLLSFSFRVIHLTGKNSPSYSYRVPSFVLPFESEMEHAYLAADLAVCRCGASTSAELIRYRLPAVVIPYPYAHDHQKENGRFLEGGVRMLLQKEATPERLAEEIEELQRNLEQYRRAFGRKIFPQTTDFANLIRTVGGIS